MRADVQVPGRADGSADASAGAPVAAPSPLRPAARAAARAALLDAVTAALDARAADWLAGVLERADEARAVDVAFGSAPRRTGRAPLAVGGAFAAAAPGLASPPRVDVGARMLICLARSDHDPDAPERLLRHADVDEGVAIYRALSLFPEGVRLDAAVARGLRTHATPTFEAIAHANPWPAAHLDEPRWNHLVLKALFVDVALHPIPGLDARANPTLARMLLDFADERRAAGRPVPAELWRCALPFAASERLARHAPSPAAAEPRAGT